MKIDKNLLLETNYFIDNEYLTNYCDLMNKNIAADYIYGKSQKHHVIPVCTYGIKQNINRKENIKSADIDPNNIQVNLLYKDHILAHYYLCLCCSSEIFYKLFFGLNLLLNADSIHHCKTILMDLNIEELNLDMLQKIYEKAHLIDRGRKIICIETQEVNTAKYFSRQLNCYSGSILSNCRGNTATCQGYHWAYITDTIRINNLKEFIGKDPETFTDICRRKSNRQKGHVPTLEHRKALLEAAAKNGQNIYCIDLDIMFESVTYANMYLRENLNLKIPKDSRQVGLAARRSKSHKAYGHYWLALDKSDSLDDYKHVIDKIKSNFKGK